MYKFGEETASAGAAGKILSLRRGGDCRTRGWEEGCARFRFNASGSFDPVWTPREARAEYGGPCDDGRPKVPASGADISGLTGLNGSCP